MSLCYFSPPCCKCACMRLKHHTKYVLLCLQTFSITDPVVQRQEIDGVCLFFVMVGVVSFFTQMLQVQFALTRALASTLLTYTPCLCSRIRESHKRPTSFWQMNTFWGWKIFLQWSCSSNKPLVLNARVKIMNIFGIISINYHFIVTKL